MISRRFSLIVTKKNYVCCRWLSTLLTLIENTKLAVLFVSFCNSHTDPIHLCDVFCRDLQSYFADLSLFLANDSKKMYIFVDNRPWLRDLGSRGAHIWQLMVTKVPEYTIIIYSKLILVFFLE